MTFLETENFFTNSQLKILKINEKSFFYLSCCLGLFSPQMRNLEFVQELSLWYFSDTNFNAKLVYAWGLLRLVYRGLLREPEFKFH